MKLLPSWSPRAVLQLVSPFKGWSRAPDSTEGSARASAGRGPGRPQFSERLARLRAGEQQVRADRARLERRERQLRERVSELNRLDHASNAANAAVAVRARAIVAEARRSGEAISYVDAVDVARRAMR